MFSSESEVVRNDIFLSKLEKKVISLSDKYGLGERLFREKNPANNNSSNAFIIKAPENWSNQRIFDVWEPISDEVHDFARTEGIECLAEICFVTVSNRYWGIIMTHAFVPQHLLYFAEHLQKTEFSDKNYELQCINRTIVNRAYLSTYLHAEEWIITNGPHYDVRDYSEKNVGYHTLHSIRKIK